MKDQYGGKSIVKFVGLKSKMYLQQMKVITKRSPAKFAMVLQSFIDALFKKKILRHTMRRIGS